MTARTARCAAEGVVSAERGENVWRNLGYAAGAAAATTTAGFVLQAVAPTVTRAAAQFCLGHVTICSVAAPAFKVVDYGWTGYDVWQATRTLKDDEASFSEKLTAGLTIGLSIWSEALEPDELLPVNLPLDDVARREVTHQFEQNVREKGAAEGFQYLREVLGDDADEIIAALIEKVGDEQYIRVTQQSGRVARVADRYADDVLEIGADGLLRVEPAVAEKLGREIGETTGLQVWVSAERGAVYVSHSTQEGVQYATALALAKQAGGVESEVEKQLVRQIAEACTRGSGNRVVLGAWQEGSGYIGEAVAHGGVFFDTGDEVWQMLKASGVDPWEVNEAFLRRQLGAGVERIDFISGDASALLRKYAGIADEDVPYRVRELRWLMENAEKFGYVWTGNSWLLRSLP